MTARKAELGKEIFMDIKKYQDLYKRADNLPKKIEGVTAYGCGCSLGEEIADIAVDVLMDFYDLLAENYEDNNTCIGLQQFITCLQ